MFVPACYSPFHVHLNRFILQLFLPLWVCFFFVFVQCLSLLISKKNSGLLLEANITMSAFGGLFSSFYIGVVSQVFSLFQKYEHPNQSESLLSASSIVYGQEDWFKLLGVSVPAICVFCIGYMVVVFYVCISAPRRFIDPGWRMRWKFLFSKSIPSLWWWSVVMLSKSLLLTFSIVLFKESWQQISVLFLIFLWYALLVSFCLPWRSFAASVQDVIGHSCLCCVTSMGLDYQSFGFVYTLVRVVPFISFFILSGLLQFSRWKHDDKSKKQTLQNIATVFAEFGISLSAQTDFVDRVCLLPFVDVRVLSLSSAIIAREVLGREQYGSLARTSSTPVSKKEKISDGHLIEV